jgi:hypothetical protein
MPEPQFHRCLPLDFTWGIAGRSGATSNRSFAIVGHAPSALSWYGENRPRIHFLQTWPDIWKAAKPAGALEATSGFGDVTIRAEAMTASLDCPTIRFHGLFLKVGKSQGAAV